MFHFTRVTLASIGLSVGVVLGGCASPVDEDPAAAPSEESSAQLTDESAASPAEAAIPGADVEEVAEVGVAAPLPTELFTDEAKDKDDGNVGSKSDPFIYGGFYGYPGYGVAVGVPIGYGVGLGYGLGYGYGYGRGFGYTWAY